MVDLSIHIKSIQDKVQHLLKQQTLLQKENQRLKKELEKLAIQNGEKQEMIVALQQQADALKLGSGTLNETEKNALGKRIDMYLKEIDKCLALLNT